MGTPLPRTSLFVSLASLLLLWPRAAQAQVEGAPPAVAAAPSAEGEQSLCLRSFDDAQRRRAAGELRAAREQLIVCGQAGCPAVVQGQCVAWLRDLDESLPSIVVVAKDHAGHDAVDVRVTCDGEVVAETLDGRPIALDPGPHTLHFEHAGSPDVELSIVVVEGQQNRELTVLFAPSKPAKKRSRPRPQPLYPAPVEALDLLREEPPPSRGALFYTGLGVGAAGALAGTLSGIVALSQGSALQNACTNGVCPPDKRNDLERGTTIAHVSTVSFAVGGAGLLVALIAALVDGPSSPEPKTSTALVYPSTRGFSFDLTGQL